MSRPEFAWIESSGKPIVHFGSPSGTDYEREPEAEPEAVPETGRFRRVWNAWITR